MLWYKNLWFRVKVEGGSVLSRHWTKNYAVHHLPPLAAPATTRLVLAGHLLGEGDESHQEGHEHQRCTGPLHCQPRDISHMETAHHTHRDKQFHSNNTARWRLPAIGEEEGRRTQEQTRLVAGEGGWDAHQRKNIIFLRTESPGCVMGVVRYKGRRRGG